MLYTVQRSTNPGAPDTIIPAQTYVYARQQKMGRNAFPEALMLTKGANWNVET